MNFYTCEENFILLAKLKHELWQNKVEKRGALTWLIAQFRSHNYIIRDGADRFQHLDLFCHHRDVLVTFLPYSFNLMYMP